jgi:hypothetical protein
MCRLTVIRLIGFVVLAGFILVLNFAQCKNASSDKLEFSLYDSYGRQVRSVDYKGVPVFLEFGACW